MIVGLKKYWNKLVPKILKTTKKAMIKTIKKKTIVKMILPCLKAST